MLRRMPAIARGCSRDPDSGAGRIGPFESHLEADPRSAWNATYPRARRSLADEIG